METDLTDTELQNLSPGCIAPHRAAEKRGLLSQINAHHNKGRDMELRFWDHHRFDRYVVIIRHPWFDKDGTEIAHHCDLVEMTFGQCVIHGYELAEGDDFHIGVIRDRRLVALLWVDQVVEDDPIALDEIAREIGIGA